MLTQSSHDHAGGPVRSDGSCCHYWIIQPAVGPVSDGTCQRCGQVREFLNSSPPAAYHRRSLERPSLDLLSAGPMRDYFSLTDLVGANYQAAGSDDD